jgi:UDP-glucose 4-epimerase
MRVLVTGGAGYIGSVVVEELQKARAERVVVLDDLSKGHMNAVASGASFVCGDIGDRPLVTRVCRDERIDAIVHMAASSLVGESVEKPALYYQNNMVKGLTLLDAAVDAGVRRIVFSSTAAVYGEPAETPITEQFPNQPTNTYGETKLAFEKALGWYERAYALRYTSLRYFNAAGATETHGEAHAPETHLIPIVLAAARGERESVSVYGTDYPTPDGTCVRDYIHVSDLARAHVLAIEAMGSGKSGIFNLGCGGGFSVRQVIESAERVTGRRIPWQAAPRRAGDPAVLVASSEHARNTLGFAPERQELDTIVKDAWAWLETHPNRYR